MKQLIAIILLSICISSCYWAATLDSSNDPFVVDKIVERNRTHSEYLDGTYYIILPSGLYNIGDTISIYDCHIVETVTDTILYQRKEQVIPK